MSSVKQNLFGRTFAAMLAGEFVGTFALVFAGTGAIIVNEFSKGAISHVGIALTFGMIIIAMIYAFGEVSGAHLNPAVTVAFWSAGRFPFPFVPPYIVSQTLGALLASLLWRWLMPQSETLGSTLPQVDASATWVLEFLLTFLLMLVIIQTTSGSRETGILAGLAIGTTVGLEAMFAGPLTGASMNPARSIGPALISGHTEMLWIYLSAPVAGAFASVGYHKIFRTNTKS